MTGKPQFEEPAVIAAAVDVFWRHGYAAASISDLVEATGLSRSSIYQRFRDKDGLFLEAFSAYTERVLHRMNAVQADSARDRLDALLRGFLPDASIPPRPPGCLIARSCTETEELSAAGRSATQAAVASQRDVLLRILGEGVQNGELPNDTDIDTWAWHYLGVLQAVLNFTCLGADQATLGPMIDVAMSAWPRKA